MREINGEINGKCVQLTINNCLELTQQQSIKTRNWDFDPQTEFISKRFETKSDIENFFNNPMLNRLVVTYHEQETIVEIEYSGRTFFYNWSIGRWWVSDYDNHYYTEGIRYLVWDKIINRDADKIKSEYLLKRKMISALMEL